MITIFIGKHIDQSGEKFSGKLTPSRSRQEWGWTRPRGPWVPVINQHGSGCTSSHTHALFQALLFEAAPDTDCPLENTDTFRVPHQETERCSRERQTKPHSWLHSCGLSQLGSPLTLPWVSSHNVPSVLAPRQFTSGSRSPQPLNQLTVPMQGSRLLGVGLAAPPPTDPG